MDRKTTGILLTGGSALLCGCPGLFLCLFGGLSAAGAGTYDLGTDVGQISSGAGIALLCLGILLTLIPLGVGYFSLRNRPAAVASTAPDEPLPPPR
ncbi:MAG TPA: hypothetical protein VGA03_08485 [Anaerolineales bacterium]